MKETVRVPVASVVMPCHDASATIGLQLESLARQVGAPDFEVVLVDNRSTDDLAAAVAPWVSRLHLTVVSARAHANPGYARNVGVAHARADKLLFCDADDYLAARWVADGVAYLERTPIISGSARPVAPEVFESGIEALEAFLSEGADADRLDIPAAAEAYPILMGSTKALRRDVYVQLGGYDAACPYGVEDNDLALRAQEAGFVVAHAQGMQIAYRTRPPSAITAERAYLTGFRHMLLVRRHHLGRRSPSLHRGWWLDLAKCAAVAVRMTVRPGTRDWHGLRSRAAMAAGLLAGRLWYWLPGRAPVRRLGAGLEDNTHQQERGRSTT